MKALVYIGPRHLELQESPDPVATSDCVVLKVAAVGVCGSDLHGYVGTNGRRVPGQIMGHEAVGVVTDAPDAHRHLIGQMMTFTPVIACGKCSDCRAGFDNRCVNRRLIGVHLEKPGAFAEYVHVPIANLVPWTSSSSIIGTLVEPFAVAWRSVSAIINPRPSSVLVLGAGTIGSLVALAVRERLQVTVDIYDPISWKAEWLSGLEIRSLAEPPGSATGVSNISQYEVIIDCVGSTPSLRTAMNVVAPGGRIHVVGMATPTVELQAQTAVSREVTITTSYAYTSTEFREATEFAMRLEPSLAHMNPVSCSLEDAIKNIDGLLDPDCHVGKLVICP
jgi:threonine dehydrogenase-like Zn-dependent dehydrogenase